jgi:hypothetical protein
LRGTVEVISGQTHLVGKITEGAHKGRRVETRSRLLDFGPNGSLSDIDGNMTIDGKRGSRSGEPASDAPRLNRRREYTPAADLGSITTEDRDCDNT